MANTVTKTLIKWIIMFSSTLQPILLCATELVLCPTIIHFTLRNDICFVVKWIMLNVQSSIKICDHFPQLNSSVNLFQQNWFARMMWARGYVSRYSRAKQICLVSRNLTYWSCTFSWLSSLSNILSLSKINFSRNMINCNVWKTLCQWVHS